MTCHNWPRNHYNITWSWRHLVTWVGDDFRIRFLTLCNITSIIVMRRGNKYNIVFLWRCYFFIYFISILEWESISSFTLIQMKYSIPLQMTIFSDSCGDVNVSNFPEKLIPTMSIMSLSTASRSLGICYCNLSSIFQIPLRESIRYIVEGVRTRAYRQTAGIKNATWSWNSE